MADATGDTRPLGAAAVAPPADFPRPLGARELVTQVTQAGNQLVAADRIMLAIDFDHPQTARRLWRQVNRRVRDAITALEGAGFRVLR